MPRGVANGRVLLLITTLLVTFGTIAVASASEGQSTANGGSAWSIMIHDLVYLGFGIFALYLASRVRLDRLVRAAPVLIIFGLGLLVAVRAIGVTSNGGKRWLNLHVMYLQPSELFNSSRCSSSRGWFSTTTTNSVTGASWRCGRCPSPSGAPSSSSNRTSARHRWWR